MFFKILLGLFLKYSINEIFLIFRFSFWQLPLWAKKDIDGVEVSAGGPRVSGPKGRWAQRIDQTGITIKSVYDSDSIIQFPPKRG